MSFNDLCVDDKIIQSETQLKDLRIDDINSSGDTSSSYLEQHENELKKNSSVSDDCLSPLLIRKQKKIPRSVLNDIDHTPGSNLTRAEASQSVVDFKESTNDGLRATVSMNDLYKAAKDAQVTQKEVVSVFGEMVNKLALKGDDCLKTKSVSSDLKTFQGPKKPKVSIEWYLWRIVYYLNKFPHVESTFFAEDTNTISADLSSGNTMNTDAENAPISRGLRSFLIALVYVDRVSELHEDFILSSFSVHRVFLTAMLVAAKFLDDFRLGVNVFARLGGVSLSEMKTMESKFCSLIGFDLIVGEQEFQAKCLRNLQFALDVACLRRNNRSD